MHFKVECALQKSFVVIALFVFMSINIAYSQGNTWKLNGNNNVDSNSFIGPVNFEDFKFKTNDLLKMIITKAGDVGIGLLPQEKLHVMGNMHATGFIKSGNSATFDGPFDRMLDDNNIFNL